MTSSIILTVINKFVCRVLNDYVECTNKITVRMTMDYNKSVE